MGQRTALALAALGILASIGCSEPRSNVVLISIDTLRADHLGAYGYSRDTSPFLDRLAGEGLLFESCITSSPWTLPSHVSLLTGLVPSTHGVMDDGLGSVPQRGPHAIPAAIPTLPEILQDAGYATSAVVSHLYVSDRFGFDRGFDRFDYVQERPAEHITRAALDWLGASPRKPFFLFLHYFDPHDPYAAPEPYGSQFLDGPRNAADGRFETIVQYMHEEIPPEALERMVALYDGEIRYVDAAIEALVAGLAEAGVLDDTVILLTSDHGEEFKDHGSLGHSMTLFDEVTRVPLILRLPESLSLPGGRIPEQVRSIDVLPTLLDLVGIEPPEGLEGRSLVPLIENGGTSPGGAPIAHSETSRYDVFAVSARSGEAKTILANGLGGRQRSTFDLAVDPGERAGRIGDGPEGVSPCQEAAFRSLDLVCDSQMALRIALPRETKRVSGQLRTSGRFRFVDSTGWWPRGSISVSSDRKQVTVDLARRARPVGISWMVEPADASIELVNWRLDAEPAAIRRLEAGAAPAHDPGPVASDDLLARLTPDPGRARLDGTGLLLYRSTGPLPRRAVSDESDFQRKQVSPEDLERLEALGYVQ